eukprot:scaffold271468_cov32-Tisochrysis_lutea.AAC.5
MFSSSPESATKLSMTPVSHSGDTWYMATPHTEPEPGWHTGGRKTPSTSQPRLVMLVQSSIARAEGSMRVDPK